MTGDPGLGPCSANARGRGEASVPPEPTLPSTHLDRADVIQRIGDQGLEFGEPLGVLVPDELMDDV